MLRKIDGFVPEGLRRGALDGARVRRAAGVAAEPKPLDPPKKAGALRVALLVAAVVCIIAGALNGGARDVLYKAITICTECVGLG